MDHPPQINHDSVREALGSVGNWIMWFIVAIVSGSVSAVKRAGTVSVAAYWIVLTALIGPGLAVIAVAYWGADGYVGAVICLAVGLMIAGIASQLDRLNKRVGDANINIPMLPGTGIVTPENPPEIKEPKK